MLDPVVSLAFIAAHTRTIRLATGILLVPQLNPLVVAKELASLDVLSGGRLIFGTGVSWSEHEYEVLGVPYHDRGACEDDYLKAIKAVWPHAKVEPENRILQLVADHMVYMGAGDFTVYNLVLPKATMATDLANSVSRIDGVGAARVELVDEHADLTSKLWNYFENRRLGVSPVQRRYQEITL
jgi:hypothetical protein